MHTHIIHKYTNTQIHKYTNTQIHKYTNIGYLVKNVNDKDRSLCLYSYILHIIALRTKMSEPTVLARFFRNPYIIWCTVSEYMWRFTSEIYLKKMPEFRTNTFTKPSVKSFTTDYTTRYICPLSI